MNAEAYKEHSRPEFAIMDSAQTEADIAAACQRLECPQLEEMIRRCDAATESMQTTYRQKWTVYQEELMRRGMHSDYTTFFDATQGEQDAEKGLPQPPVLDSSYALFNDLSRIAKNVLRRRTVVPQ